MSNIDGCLCRIALISVMGDEVVLELKVHEFLSVVEVEEEREEERRKEVRMLEMEEERDWKRVVRILNELS